MTTVQAPAEAWKFQGEWKYPLVLHDWAVLLYHPESDLQKYCFVATMVTWLRAAERGGDVAFDLTKARLSLGRKPPRAGSAPEPQRVVGCLGVRSPTPQLQLPVAAFTAITHGVLLWIIELGVAWAWQFDPKVVVAAAGKADSVVIVLQNLPGE